MADCEGEGASAHGAVVRRDRGFSRRGFIASAAVAAGAVAARPARARRLGDETIIGDGEHVFRVRHHFPKLPDRYSWQTTHNVAVDAAGNLYVIHEGRRAQKEHPAIFVFDPEGTFVRAFGSQFQGGGHGIEVRREGNEEFLYVCGYQQVKSIAKLTLAGETVWYRKAPMESGAYAPGEDLSTEPTWTRQGFLPTNVAFLGDGVETAEGADDILVADGYGAFRIHRYDRDGTWKSCFGGPGDGKGTFKTPHGLWVDRRPGREPSIVVADRAHNTLQTFTLDGGYQETIEGFGLPANLDTWKHLMVVPELKACVTLLDAENKVVAQLGRAVERLAEIKDLRQHPEQWIDGQFVHPHDACFTPAGDIFVAEWVATGRITKLERVDRPA
jgi:hypothetical protein